MLLHLLPGFIVSIAVVASRCVSVRVCVSQHVRVCAYRVFFFLGSRVHVWIVFVFVGFESLCWRRILSNGSCRGGCWIISVGAVASFTCCRHGDFSVYCFARLASICMFGVPCALSVQCQYVVCLLACLSTFVHYLVHSRPCSPSFVFMLLFLLPMFPFHALCHFL